MLRASRDGEALTFEGSLQRPRSAQAFSSSSPRTSGVDGLFTLMKRSASTSSAPTPSSPERGHPYSTQLARSAAATTSSNMRDTTGDGADCPVCMEPLSMRLAGEKPSVQPVCGHRLHEACFESVYGRIDDIKKRANIGMRPQSIGLCGVCRRDMKLGEGTETGARRDKFAAISGMPNDTNDFKVRSISKRTHPATDVPFALHNPAEDDEPLTLQSNGRASEDTLRRPSSSGSAGAMVAQPLITVRSETSSIARPADRQGRTRVTTLVTVEMPSRLSKDALAHWDQTRQSIDEGDARRPSMADEKADSDAGEVQTVDKGKERETPTNGVDNKALGFSHATTRPLSTITEHDIELQKAFEDLKQRMSDWKGHQPDLFGKLKILDTLQVAKDQSCREFQVFLFEDVLLCVTDDRRRGVAGRMVDGMSTSGSDKMRLKGRVFVRHIRHIEVGEDLTLTITMGDEMLEGFTLHFEDEGTLQAWKTQIETLMQRGGAPGPPPTGPMPAPPPSAAESRNRPSHPNARNSTVSSGPSTSSSGAFSSVRSSYTTATTVGSPKIGSNMSNGHSSASGATLAAGLGPASYPALDLVLILSVPPLQQRNGPSAAAVTSRVLRNTAEFLVSSGCIGPSARVSIIAYCAGDGLRGILKKTALLSVERSSQRLMTAVQELAADIALGQERELQIVNHNDDRVSVVTAVNLALDILLQRNRRAPLTGVVLVNDGKDGAPKQQMDLVMTRADHAGVPIHAFGWGRTHDPSSLWLLSNHTGGTYTLVRDWYGLRDAVAACVGGMLSINATAFKLHISVPEKRWFSIRKVAGVQNAVISGDGKDADIDLGEMRAGERRELLVEIEMSSIQAQVDTMRSDRRRTTHLTATDEYFMNSVGLDPMSLEEDSLYDEESDSTVDDIPLFEVNANFRDPIAGKFVSRLPQPILLTISVTPPTGQIDAAGSPRPDAVVVRRRIELLCSDMMTRCLLLMSRRNPSQALRLLTETRRIVQTILSSISTPPVSHRRPPSLISDQDDATQMFHACLEDIDYLIEGVRAATEASSDAHSFDSHRNFAAQQAVVLRDQRAWTERTLTEKAYFSADLAKVMARQSRNYLTE